MRRPLVRDVSQRLLKPKHPRTRTFFRDLALFCSFVHYVIALAVLSKTSSRLNLTSGMTMRWMAMGFEALAPELIAHVMTYLDFDDVLRCSRVRRRTHFGNLVISLSTDTPHARV